MVRFPIHCFNKLLHFNIRLILFPVFFSLWATSTEAAQTEAMMLQFVPDDVASGSLNCMQTEKKVVLQSAQTWYEEAPTPPSSLILMPSEETFQAEAQLVDHQNQKYSFTIEFNFEDKFLQSIANTELLILSGVNGFEGEGMVLEPNLVKEFLSKCMVSQ
jgi:hypothetical protein